MKLPKYLDAKHGVRVVMTDKGVYTTQVQVNNSKDFERSLKWIRRNGKKYLEQKLGYKIKNVNYEDTINNVLKENKG
jgi:hypothetical protein